jgi:hypothetical protein
VTVTLTEKRRFLATESESECETESSADESGDSNKAGATTWVKLDKTPTLGQLFFADQFFHMLCEENKQIPFPKS